MRMIDRVELHRKRKTTDGITRQWVWRFIVKCRPDISLFSIWIDYDLAVFSSYVIFCFFKK